MYKDVFNDTTANLAGQDHIPAATGGWTNKVAGIDVGMTNMRSFLETGDMKFHGPEGAVTIDFSKDDALIRHLRQAVQDVQYEIIQTDAFKELHKAENPTLEQRYAYEQELARLTFDAIEKIDGLKQYRVPENMLDGRFSESSNEIVVDNNLHSLTPDIEGNADSTVSYRTDFECDKMSAVKGMIMQTVEDSILPSDNGSLNSAGAYFNAQGGMYMIDNGFVSKDPEDLIRGEVDVERGWHTFITSSKSGAVFEATALSSDSDEPFAYKADRMFIPLAFDGHLPEQATYNYNFAVMAAGARISYVPMDPEKPGRMSPEASADDITGYQVGSNHGMFVERMMSIQSGNLSDLEELRSNIPELSMNGYKDDLKYAAADFASRKIIEYLDNYINQYDPNDLGGAAFLENFASAKISEYEGVPPLLMDAYNQYTVNGEEIPEDVLLNILNDDNLWHIHSIASALEELEKEFGEFQQGGPLFLSKTLIDAGMEEKYASIYAENLKYELWPDRMDSLKEARSMAITLRQIVDKASFLEMDMQNSNPQMAAVSMQGDQNIVDNENVVSSEPSVKNDSLVMS